MFSLIFSEMLFRMVLQRSFCTTVLSINSRLATDTKLRTFCQFRFEYEERGENSDGQAE